MLALTELKWVPFPGPWLTRYWLGLKKRFWNSLKFKKYQPGWGVVALSSN